MDRDLRNTDLFRDIEAFYRRMHEPAFGKVSAAADPHPSPNGRLVAFTGSKLEKLEGLPVTRICVAGVETGECEEVTAGPNNDRLPRWSPDGRRLAFLSDREEEGRNRLYLLDRERLGEARPIPKVDGSVEYHEWSPDGRSILLGVAGKGAELAGVQGSGVAKDEQADAPEWLPTVESSAEATGWRRAWVYDVQSDEVRAVSREGLNVWEATWCGPERLAAIVSEAPGEEAWYTAPLAVIDIGSGDERILFESKVQLGVPAVSPDGRRLAVVQALCSDRLVVAGDLYVLDPESGASSQIDTNGVDVAHLAWRDVDRLLFIGIRGLRVVAGEYDARSGGVTETWETSESSGFVYPEARPVGERGFVTVVDSYSRHPEVAVVEGSEVRPITSLAHEGSAFLDGIGRLEEVSWRAPDGLEIQGYAAWPEGAGPHPLVTWVHGGPVGATRNRRMPLIQLLVSRGLAVFLPNPRGSSGRGQAFASMVYGDMGGGDAGDILAGIDALVERGAADPGRLAVMGGSYGGFMTCWLVTQTDRFAAAASFSPVTDWYSQHFTSNIGFWDRQILEDDWTNPGGEYFRRSPLIHAKKARTPTLLTAGLVDECTPPGQAVEFHRALREHGVETDLALYPGEGHGVRKMPALFDFLTRVIGWLEDHMPAQDRKDGPTP